ncbi:cartilage intermediate layer protein 2-like [Seriola aureovittata]|uniref:cartilage intermediate layer protein 2-like n=1 Tax=Seriola aureovittata TaxID=2871759 RepID=UPI0024BE82C4|nr:cartilage intermediate layer protein 2-like [Seriola aureovittata]
MVTVIPVEKGSGSIPEASLTVALVAGLVFESNQQDSKSPALSKSKRPCNYPTNTRCWTDWFDRDDPGGRGDFEVLNHLRSENPGKICANPVDIEVTTLSGLSATSTGDVFHKMDTTTGFICRKTDQSSKKCNDYRVRFSCHPPFCGGGVCWTKWYDRDDPSGTGDWELLKNLRKENPDEICDNPLFIEAVTTDTLTPAVDTGETFNVFSPTKGFVCLKKDQSDGTCRDYKVRFGCPCSVKNPEEC